MFYLLLMQVAYPGAWDLDNGAFGSIAGHPYWDTYIELLTERASISPAEGPLRYDHVVKSTGPDVTYDVSCPPHDVMTMTISMGCDALCLFDRSSVESQVHNRPALPAQMLASNSHVKLQYVFAKLPANNAPSRIYIYLPRCLATQAGMPSVGWLIFQACPCTRQGGTGLAA